MVNPTATHDVRQVDPYHQLQQVCEPGSLEQPDPAKRYVCVIRNDYTHWCGTLGKEMAVVGYAARECWFRFGWFDLGICRQCLS